VRGKFREDSLARTWTICQMLQGKSSRLIPNCKMLSFEKPVSRQDRLHHFLAAV